MLYIGKRKGDFTSKYFGSGKYLKNAIAKYNRDNFKQEVICYADDKEQANIMEYYHIKEYRHKYGKEMMYNIADGGEGGIGSPKGRKMSEEAIEKMRSIKLGKKQSPGHIEKRRQGMLGKNLGKSYIGRKVLPQTKEKIRLTLTGTKLSSERKEKIRLTLINYNRCKKRNQGLCN